MRINSRKRSNTSRLNRKQNARIALLGVLLLLANLYLLKSELPSLRLGAAKKKQNQNFLWTHSKSVKDCSQWAVVATVHAPEESIFRVLNLRGWCLVVVGDVNTPDDAYTILAAQHDHMVYISASYQTEMKLSLAGKNLGYLYAISHGAKVVFDLDDENVLRPLEDGTSIPPPFLYSDDSGFDRTVLFQFTTDPKGSENNGESRRELASSDLMFNPYLYMAASPNFSRPKGFPFDQRRDDFNLSSRRTTSVHDIKYSSIGVIQAISSGEPDGNGMHPSSTKNPIASTSEPLPLLIPSDKYSPYNSQATTHLYHALWGLYLPITIPGPEGETLRSYITQRIMKDLGLYVLFTPPIVNRHRFTDKSAERHLYSKTNELLKFLDTWSSEAETLPKRILELWTALYAKNFLKYKDLKALTEWLNTLDAIDYKFPNIRKDGESVSDLRPRPQLSTEGGESYRTLPHIDRTIGSGRPDKAVVKLILMTMNEWPLLKSWLLYHGQLLGFENLYIMDGSTDARCKSFLRYARDILGANVIFTDANLNEMVPLINRLASNIAASSDFILKVDTDEFLFVRDPHETASMTPLSAYLSGFGRDNNHPLRLLQRKMEQGSIGWAVGWTVTSHASQKVCKDNYYSPPEKFPLDRVKRLSGLLLQYKRVFESRIPFEGRNALNLGGHVRTDEMVPTDFGIVHYHFRCIEIEVENCKRVLENHDYVHPSNTSEEVRVLLEQKLGLPPDHDICHKEYEYESIASVHKASFYLKWLICPEKMESEYYEDGVVEYEEYPDFAYLLRESEEKYGMNDYSR